MTEVRNDNLGLFLARELEYIIPEVFETEYADIKYSTIIPVTSEAGPVADSITYRIYDSQGRMKVIQDKAQDLPRTDVVRREVSQPVRSIGGSFAYTFHEMRAAQTVPGMSLDQRRANAARRAYEETVQEIAYFGDSPSGIKGFFNNDQIDKLVPDKWLDSASTPDECLQLLNEAPTRIVQNTNMKERPDTMLLPFASYRHISVTPRSATSDTTILEFFLRTNPYITAIEPVNELEAAKSGGKLSKDRMVIYKRDPMKLEFHLPQPLEFMPPERKNLEYSVAAHARVGGLSLYYPKSVMMVEKA
jgi:hypothetical protein